MRISTFLRLPLRRGLVATALMLAGCGGAAPPAPVATTAAATPLFATSFESGQPAPTWRDTIDWSRNVSGYFATIAPECSTRNEQAHDGSAALMYSGTDTSATSSFVYFKVFAVNLAVSASTRLSYWLRPDQSNGAFVAVDLHFTDGSALRDSGAVDATGCSVHPNAGHCGHAAPGAWTEIVSDIGRWTAGKTIDRIWVAYDHPAQTGQFRGHIDEIALTDDATQAGDVTVHVDPSRVLSTSELALGATHEHFSLDSWGDATAVANGKQLLRTSTTIQNQQLMGWGADNPEPSNGAFNWSSLDDRVQLMRDTGAIKVITLCGAPDWMKGGQPGQTDWSKLEVAPLPEHYADFAALAAAVARRYPDVTYFQVWNELKGFYLAAPNRWDYEHYTELYNQVYDALKAVNPAIRVGGPYVVVDNWSDGGSNPSPISGPYGTIDQRSLDVISYWLTHKHGADFLTVDGGPGTHDGGRPSDEFSALSYFGDVAAWIRSQPGAASLPLWWAEWYPDSAPVGTLAHDDAVMAAGLIATAQSGAAVELIWGPQGDANGVSTPEGLFTDTRNPGGGQPTPLYAMSQAFEQAFPPGTPLFAATASPPSVRVLASASHVFLVNTTATALRVDVDGTLVTVAPYDVRVVAR